VNTTNNPKLNNTKEADGTTSVSAQKMQETIIKLLEGWQRMPPCIVYLPYIKSPVH